MPLSARAPLTRTFAHAYVDEDVLYLEVDRKSFFFGFREQRSTCLLPCTDLGFSEVAVVEIEVDSVVEEEGVTTKRGANMSTPNDFLCQLHRILTLLLLSGVYQTRQLASCQQRKPQLATRSR